MTNSLWMNNLNDFIMPHLSPMNWLLSIITFWFILFTISSSSWWSQPNKFSTPSISSAITSLSPWKW